MVLFAMKELDVTNKPIWNICIEGTAASIGWRIYESNPRFAMCNTGTPSNIADDIMLDKETGFIWARHANLTGTAKRWGDAKRYCRRLTYGNQLYELYS